MYDTKYQKITIQVLLDQLKDLETWSVYNQDKHQEEIAEIKKLLKSLSIE